MSTQYRVEVITGNDPKWYTNAMRYETAQEAEAAARDLFGRWLLVRHWRVVGKDGDVDTVVVDSKTLGET